MKGYLQPLCVSFSGHSYVSYLFAPSRVASLVHIPVYTHTKSLVGGAENAGRENDGREIDGPICRA